MPGGIVCVMVIAQLVGQLVMTVTRLLKSGIKGGQPVTLRLGGGQMTKGGGAWITVTGKIQEAELPRES